MVQSLYAKGSNQEFFVYWYQVKGEVLTNEYALKIAEIRNAMLHRRKDSAFIRISVPDAANVADPAASGRRFHCAGFSAHQGGLADVKRLPATIHA